MLPLIYILPQAPPFQLNGLASGYPPVPIPAPPVECAVILESIILMELMAPNGPVPIAALFPSLFSAVIVELLI